MLKLIVLLVGVIAAISGGTTENNAEGQQENRNGQNVVEQRSSFPSSGGLQQGGFGIASYSSFNVPNVGTIPPHFNNIYDYFGVHPLYFPLYNGVNFPYSQGIYGPFVPPYNTGIIPPSYNPFYAPHCTCSPGLLNNHVDAFHSHQDFDHLNHGPTIVSTVSETVSESLPHGEQVVKETEEISTHLHEGSHFHHEPEVVSTVSEVISETLPHGGEVVKETKEFTSHTGHGPHGRRFSRGVGATK